ASKAETAEQLPRRAAEDRAERYEGHRHESHPRRCEKREDAANSQANEDPAVRDVGLDTTLHVQVVQVPGVVDDQAGAGGECGPVGVDDVVQRHQRVEDECEADAQERDIAAPAPPAHRSTTRPSVAARTSTPVRWDRSAAIAAGSARHTVIPQWVRKAIFGFASWMMRSTSSTHR